MKLYLKIIWWVLQRIYSIKTDGKRYPFIIMFHYVTNKVVRTHPSCKCSVSEFEKIIDGLRLDGYEFISIDDALNLVTRRCFHKKYCVITFDDATEDIYTEAYPILKEGKIPFVIYVPSGLVGQYGYITSLQLEELANDSLCTIGSHTINHVKLRDAKDYQKEICQSKKDLENLTRKEIKHFAYPWGTIFDCSLKNILMVKNAGYISAVSTLSAPLHLFSTWNKYYLPRVNMSIFKNEFKKEDGNRNENL